MLNNKQIDHLCLIESLREINKTELGYIVTFKTDKNRSIQQKQKVII